MGHFCTAPKDKCSWNKRFEVPAGAALVIEHEVEDDSEELSLELQWKR